MAVLTGALFSLSATGTIGKILTYGRANGKAYVKGNRLIKTDKFHFIQKKYFSQTLSQQIVRSAFKRVTINWNNLSAEEKQEYEDKAKGIPQTGLSIYMKETFSSYYNPMTENKEYQETLITGFMRDLSESENINTKQLAHIQNKRNIK